MSVAREIDDLRLTWFARAWAIAALFHLAAEPRGALETQPFLAALSAAVALTATLTLLRPNARWPLLALCALVPLYALTEAPVVGNHWVLAALVSLSLCLSALYSRVSRAGLSSGQILAAARMTVLVAYSFAAFAKLNWDFINPAVSCVVLFQDRLVGSWYLPQLSVEPYPALGKLLAILTIITELLVAALIAWPLTRRWGIVLAFGFHGLLAFDHAQHFWDFSSVLFAGYFLFLDENQIQWLRKELAGIGRRLSGSVLPTVLVCLLGLTVGVLNIAPRGWGLQNWLTQLGHAAWFGYCLFGVVAVTACAFAPKLSSQGQRREPLPTLLWLAPALAFLNGLTPYLEIKTGFGWNMYSNLRTVAGQTNHMLIPATLDLRGEQRDLVTIVSSSDPSLQRLHDEHYALTYTEFSHYAHHFPESAVTYQWRGQTHSAARLADDPAGQGPLNILAMKLLPFRLVDLERQERCQANFSPAR